MRHSVVRRALKANFIPATVLACSLLRPSPPAKRKVLCCLRHGNITSIGWRSHSVDAHAILQKYRDSFDLHAASHNVEDLSVEHIGQRVNLHGYLGPRSDVSKRLSFVPLRSKSLDNSVQIISVADSKDETRMSAHVRIKQLSNDTPVCIAGHVQSKVKPKEASRETAISRNEDVEIKLESIIVLNQFAPDIEYDENIPATPANRHLQLRQSTKIRNALAFRSRLAEACRSFLSQQHSFIEVETPLLFKSTPEGAREFLVPTRSKGFAYALPQSPQQYKQILMASGIPRYFQVARCFRDEDLRADRQPEFTQLDLEIAFATGQEVRNTVEALIKQLWASLLGQPLQETPFEHMSYAEAMSRYGSDKPDTRLGSQIMRIDHLVPVDLVSKVSDLHMPAVDAFVFKCFEDPADARKFVGEFMDSEHAKPFMSNPHGQPGIFIYDTRQPLGGLQPFGFEAAEVVEEQLGVEEGDIILIQARPNEAFSGGSTPMGNLRLALHRFAVAQKHLDPPSGWNFLWIKDFPLFSPSIENEPGQGGAAGFASTHHPFTAPASVEDIDLMLSDPLSVKADHYDLVLNGIELGGGSRRIHNAEMQRLVLKDVLQMSDERLQDFEHLINVLKAGCPPHAGMALGFDRLCAVMQGFESIRDVIAFPKSGSGSDMLVKSPTQMTKSQLAIYHLRLEDSIE